jgi:hypothetical protein
MMDFESLQPKSWVDGEGLLICAAIEPSPRPTARPVRRDRRANTSLGPLRFAVASALLAGAVVWQVRRADAVCSIGVVSAPPFTPCDDEDAVPVDYWSWLGSTMTDWSPLAEGASALDDLDPLV